MPKKKTLSFKVNGRSETLEVSPRTRLLDTLRLGLGLTGTKEGCGTGDCGTCTVLVDGRPVNSCLVMALQSEGRDVTTIEAWERSVGSIRFKKRWCSAAVSNAASVLPAW